MKPFRPAALKKTKGKSRRPGRGDLESGGDHRGYQKVYEDARCDYLPGPESPWVDHEAVASSEEGKPSLPPSTGSQEGGAV
jgi:hypothetical protein